ncbi:hypothetical protein HYX13_05975 [Candidatus Woesearchaeota archaeon]|nr:hypothetical protein [Candidatus Woesearchaeota archaeon]
MWRGGSEKHLVLITDEKAQTRYGYLNQQIVGDLLREANIMVDLYILPQHFNFLNLDEGYGEQGYGYLVCQEQGDDGSCVNPNGNAYNLDEEISAGRLGRSIRQGFIDYYCNEGETGSILEREEE